jgi:3-phosphoshikimate 1-carboxyvinyltransferase
MRSSSDRPSDRPDGVVLDDPLPIRPLVGRIDARVEVPGSKSITNRALVCAALAQGTSTLRRALDSDDTRAMAGALAASGFDLHLPQGPDRGELTVVQGRGGALAPARSAADVRQSGTTARFLLPLLALGAEPYEVTAHPQMQARPMGETFAALRALGAEVEALGEPGHLPATVRGPATGDRLEMAGDVSSQFLSGLLLIGPCLPAGLTVALTTDLVSRPYVDLTISVMASFGAEVSRPDERTFRVEPTGYRPTTYDVEPDASAASYPLAAAALTGGRVAVDGLGIGALQGDAAFADVLAAMGARVDRTSEGIVVEGRDGGRLRGGTFDFTHISDTAQTLAVLAPFADGPVTITGIGFIRRKEIDRIAAVAAELRRAGVRVDDDPDGWTIHPGPVAPTTFETYDDHRMAMSFALLGLRVPGISIAGPACVAKTFPGYWELLEALRSSQTAR